MPELSFFVRTCAIEWTGSLHCPSRYFIAQGMHTTINNPGVNKEC
jgi:hypothetical protein